MKTYEFCVWFVGKGETPEEAWQDAIEMECDEFKKYVPEWSILEEVE